MIATDCFGVTLTASVGRHVVTMVVVLVVVLQVPHMTGHICRVYSVSFSFKEELNTLASQNDSGIFSEPQFSLSSWPLHRRAFAPLAHSMATTTATSTRPDEQDNIFSRTNDINWGFQIM